MCLLTIIRQLYNQIMTFWLFMYICHDLFYIILYAVLLFCFDHLQTKARMIFFWKTDIWKQGCTWRLIIAINIYTRCSQIHLLCNVFEICCTNAKYSPNLTCLVHNMQGTRKKVQSTVKIEQATVQKLSSEPLKNSLCRNQVDTQWITKLIYWNK